MNNKEFKIEQTHTLSRALANRYGVNAAILMAYLANRIPVVQAARKDELGFYISVSQLAQRYPYFTQHIIRYTLAQLRKNDVLRTDVHNKHRYDKKLWYTFADPGVQKMATEDLVRFDVEIAQYFGVEAALVLANIKFWIAENVKKNSGFEWLRVSAHELAKHLPIPVRTINRVLQHLCEGANQVLERKPCPGFDKAYFYKVASGLNLDAPISTIDAPNYTIHTPDSRIHTPIMTIHAPDSPLHAPNPPTYNYYKNIEKNAFDRSCLKEHIQTLPASPDMCVCVSQTLACGAETDEPMRDSVSLAITAYSPHSAHSNENDVVTAETNKSSASLYYDEDLQAYFDTQMLDASLTASQKADIFKSAVHELNKSYSFGIVYTNTTYQKSKTFFELNPSISVKSLTDLLYKCMERIMYTQIGEVQPDKYDNAFYARRATNLSFFFKYLHEIGAWAESEIACCEIAKDEPVNEGANV